MPLLADVQQVLNASSFVAAEFHQNEAVSTGYLVRDYGDRVIVGFHSPEFYHYEEVLQLVQGWQAELERSGLGQNCQFEQHVTTKCSYEGRHLCVLPK